MLGCYLHVTVGSVEGNEACQSSIAATLYLSNKNKAEKFDHGNSLQPQEGRYCSGSLSLPLFHFFFGFSNNCETTKRAITTFAASAEQ